MSDPLSITAGIAGFISLGIQVTQTLVDFYSTYKNQDNDVAKIIQNTEHLESLFRTLETAVQQAQNEPDAIKLLQEVEKATEKCHEVIQELQSEREKFQVTPDTINLKLRIQVATRRATYPFRKSTLQKIEEDIGEIRENLLFALNVLQFKRNNRIEDEISAVRSLLERSYSTQVSVLIRAWLQAPDVSMNHYANYAKHHPKTGDWFINSHHFANWLVERNSFIWLHGFAGSGKSVLCSIVIQRTFRETLRELKLGTKVGVALYYFAFDDESKKDAHGMLRALLLQLSVQFQGGERELEQLRMNSEPYKPSKEVLLQGLRSFLGEFQDSYIVLDALDECPRDDSREDVLDVIQTIRDWSLPSVHLLVTARDQLDIRRSLNPSHGCDLSMKNSGTDKDIYDFVSHQLEHDRQLQRWKVRHEEIQEKLTQGARGVFRYVECQLNSFRRARNRNQLDKCLQTLPRDLDQTYERIFCDIEESYIEDVRRILTVVCFSTRPLTVSELTDAHSVELEDGESPYLDREGRSYEQDDLIDICLGLIEIVETKDNNGQMISTVRIAHFSVQEYLQSDRIYQQKAKIFAIDSASANAELLQICLAYLLNPELSEGTLDEAKLQDFPLAHFAAVYWYHFYQGAQEKRLIAKKLLLRMFLNEGTSFVTWFRLHRIDKPEEMGIYDRPLDDIQITLPIYYASFLGLEITLRGIFEKYDGPSRLLKILVNEEVGAMYGNALQAASYNGHTQAVQLLLDQGANIDARCGQYGYALQAAAVKGHSEVVQLLLDQGADPNIETELPFYVNALQAAVWEDHSQIVQMLLDQGADVHAQAGDYGNALQLAAWKGSSEVVRILLNEGADVNAQGGYYGNALQAASIDGWSEVVQILLDQGAEVNAQGGYHGNALQAAATDGWSEVVQILLDRGADVNAEGGYYANALQAASGEGRSEVVQMLLDQGADVNAQGGHYGNALQAASQRGHSQVVQILLDHGAEMNAQGGHHGNALQAASEKGRSQVVQMLLDQGADVNVQGGNYDSALQAASEKGHTQIVQMLLDQGAGFQASAPQLEVAVGID